MNTITRQEATEEQLEEIHHHIHAYMDSLAECLEGVDVAGIPVADGIKMILGVGVKAGALGKFENLNITDSEVSFDAWIRIGMNNPGLYYKLKTVINIDEKRASVIEY